MRFSNKAVTVVGGVTDTTPPHQRKHNSSAAAVEIIGRMPNQPTEIIASKLWLGPAPLQPNGEPFGESTTLSCLQAAGVSHVVNCTPAHPFPTLDQLHVVERRCATTAKLFLHS